MTGEWACQKRGYRSIRAARLAHRRTKCGFRLRIYLCPECRFFHVAAAEKRSAKLQGDWPGEVRRHEPVDE